MGGTYDGKISWIQELDNGLVRKGTHPTVSFSTGALGCVSNVALHFNKRRLNFCLETESCNLRVKKKYEQGVEVVESLSIVFTVKKGCTVGWWCESKELFFFELQDALTKKSFTESESMILVRKQQYEMKWNIKQNEISLSVI